MTKSTAADQGQPQPAEVRLGSGRGHFRASARSRQLASEVVPGEPFAGIPPSRPHHSRTLGSEQHMPCRSKAWAPEPASRVCRHLSGDPAES